jgi:hypothetical protein
MESQPSAKDILLPAKGWEIFATETMMERPRSSSVVRFKGTGINDIATGLIMMMMMGNDLAYCPKT